MHILCYCSYTICVHFNVINPFRPWSSQQSLPFKFFQQHFLCIYHLSTEHKKMSVCLWKPQLSSKQRWQLGILTALFKTTRVSARDIQSHIRGNNALVGIAASQFVGNIKLSLESFQQIWRAFREKSISIYPSKAMAHMNEYIEGLSVGNHNPRAANSQSFMSRFQWEIHYIPYA